MEWVSDLLTFVSGQTGKAVVTLIGLGGPFLTIGFWIGKRLGQNKRVVALRQLKATEEQLENAHKGHQKEQRHSASLTKELLVKRGELKHAKEQLAGATDKLDLAKRKLIPYYQAYVALKPRYDQCKKEYDAEKQRVAQLAGDQGEAEKAIIDLRAELDQRQQALDKIERRTKQALKLEGNLWSAKALQARPKFRPLSERNRPIISVLNLKGGVGKTTVTAQLGLALAKMGYRVLLVDLDFQGSLTQMFLPVEFQKALAQNHLLLHHFFDRASADPTTKILDYVQTPKIDVGQGGGKLGLVAASDDLAYTELNLTLRWLLRRGDRDNRFLLRKALHMKSVSRAYDIFILDCPPIVNVSCINALAASDYLLTPVTLSRTVMERVPVLLKRFLRDPRFINHINQQLRVLGLVANRTHRDELSAIEREDWKLLGGWCRDVFGTELKQFATIIQQLNRELRDNETLLTEQRQDTKLSQLFAALAAEIERELPNECRRRAAALS